MASTLMRLVTFSCLAAALTVPSLAAAQGAFNGGGGGSIVRGIPYELYLRQNKFDPKTEGLGGENEVAEIASQLPSLGKRMALMYKKAWIRAQPGDIQQLSKAQTGIPLATTEVIYQTKRFVFVDDAWMKSATAEAKSILIRHELWQSIRVANNSNKDFADNKEHVHIEGGYLAPEAVPEMTFDLAERKVSDRELQKKVREARFGSYATAEEYQRVMAVLTNAREQARKACATSKGSARIERLNAIGIRVLKAQGGRRPDFLEGVAAEYIRQENALFPENWTLFTAGFSLMTHTFMQEAEGFCKELPNFK